MHCISTGILFDSVLKSTESLTSLWQQRMQPATMTTMLVLTGKLMLFLQT